MKKLAILLIAAFMAGCKGNTGTQQDSDMQRVKEVLAQKGIDTTDISAIYDSDKQSLEISQKGKFMTISYKQHFKDLLSDNPTTYSDRFLISMVVFQKGVTQINRLEFVCNGVKFEAVPFCAGTIDEKGAAMAGFSTDDESTRKCLDMLSKIAYMSSAKYYTNKGAFKLPDKDLMNLMSMARSYVIDGGKFE